MLKLDHVSKQYEAKDKTVKTIQDLSLVAEEGKFVVLVGPSGCGKTTLLKIIAGLVSLHQEILRWTENQLPVRALIEE